MTDAVYSQAVEIAAIGHAGRGGGALARLFRAASPAQAMVRRMYALRRLNSGLGVLTLPAAVRRSAPKLAGQNRIAGYRSGVFAGRGAAVTAGQPSLMRAVAGIPSAHHGLLARPAVATAPTLGAAAAPPAIRSGRNLFAGPRPEASASVSRGPGLPVRLTRRGIDAAPAAMADVRPSPSELVGPRLAARAARVSYAVASGIKSGARPPSRSHSGAPWPQQATAPGFHRTVRAAQSKPAAGDVYLDKALVGYHLAAAITGEQTRAAGRPNISGSSFNSSMAALRPSGAGL